MPRSSAPRARAAAVAPGAPVLGKSFVLVPVSGVVFVRLPAPRSTYGPMVSPALAKGNGFVRLTTATRLPAGTQVDSRQGSLRLIAATGQIGKTQAGVFSGAVFSLAQDRAGLTKGLTNLSLLEGDIPGGPSFASCASTATASQTASGAGAALSSRLLQTLRASAHGNFRTVGRFSAGTVRGTLWGTEDRCDGTLTWVARGTVVVTDFVRHVIVIVHAGHRYLARAPATYASAK
jgi:hypothetical protein